MLLHGGCAGRALESASGRGRLSDSVHRAALTTRRASHRTPPCAADKATMYMLDFAVYKPPESHRVCFPQQVDSLANPGHPMAGMPLASEEARAFMK